jgi:hypothetical protein
VRFGFLLLVLLCLRATAQDVESLLSKLKMTESVPAGLLSAKSVVLYSPVLQKKELETLQKSFQQTGIDAVAYFESDLILAGKDVTTAFANAFVTREIKYSIFLNKGSGVYSLIVTPFNEKATFVDAGQAAWQVKNENIGALASYVYGTALSSQKRGNFLVTDFVEEGDLPVVIRGRRSEFFAIDLQVDKLAVPKFGNEAMDAELEAYFKTNFPFQYQLVDATADEKELRKQGMLYTLCFIHARGKASKQILGYDMSKSESALASVTYPNGQLQLKTIPSQTPVYKFYFRHIDSGNVYLGTKWDADISWQDALNNHIRGLKTELKIN